MLWFSNFHLYLSDYRLTHLLNVFYKHSVFNIPEPLIWTHKWPIFVPKMHLFSTLWDPMGGSQSLVCGRQAFYQWGASHAPFENSINKDQCFWSIAYNSVYLLFVYTWSCYLVQLASNPQSSCHSLQSPRTEAYHHAQHIFWYAARSCLWESTCLIKSNVFAHFPLVGYGVLEEWFFCLFVFRKYTQPESCIIFRPTGQCSL